MEVFLDGRGVSNSRQLERRTRGDVNGKPTDSHAERRLCVDLSLPCPARRTLCECRSVGHPRSRLIRTCLGSNVRLCVVRLPRNELMCGMRILRDGGSRPSLFRCPAQLSCLCEHRPCRQLPLSALHPRTGCSHLDVGPGTVHAIESRPLCGRNEYLAHGVSGARRTSDGSGTPSNGGNSFRCEAFRPNRDRRRLGGSPASTRAGLCVMAMRT